MATDDTEKYIMTPSLFHARPHIGESPYYLHYWISHAPDAVTTANKIGNKTEIEILEKAKRRLDDAWTKKMSQLRGSNGSMPSLEDAATIEAMLLDPKWLDSINFSNAGAPSNIQMPQIKNIEDVDPADMLVEAQQCLNQISSQFQIIENDIMKSLNITSKDVQDYADFLESFFTSGVQAQRSVFGKGTQTYTKTANSSSGVTDWQAKVLESILSRNNEAFFQKSTASYLGKFAQWDAEKTKLLALIRVLKEPQALKYVSAVADAKVEVRHGNSKTGEELNNVYQAIGELLTKMKKYLQQLHAIGAEAASAAAIGAALEKINKMIKDFHLTTETEISKEMAKQIGFRGKNLGAGSFEVTKSENLEGNKHLFDQVKEKGESVFKNATWRSSKSDNFMTISNERVTVQLGVSVKDYTSVSISSKQNTANISLQKGTPLLTLLTREANLNATEMHALYQILVGHYEEAGVLVNEGSSNVRGLAYIWNNVIDKVKYLALLDTLAGFTNEADQAFYMVFNRKIYTMSDILSYISNMQDYKQLLNWNVYKGNPDALKYEGYLDLGRWVGDTDRASSSFAEERSIAATKDISRRMYDAKIEVKLHIADLYTFINLGRGK